VSTGSTTTIDVVANVVAQAASDASFRQQLLSSPAATLESAGIPIPSGATVRVLENTSTTAWAIVPPRPSDVSDADLQQTSTDSGGSTAGQNLVGYGSLVISMWTDSDLKSRFLADPAAVFAERGISVPAGVTVKAVEATSDTLYMTIPELQS